MSVCVRYWPDSQLHFLSKEVIVSTLPRAYSYVNSLLAASFEYVIQLHSVLRYQYG